MMVMVGSMDLGMMMMRMRRRRRTKVKVVMAREGTWRKVRWRAGKLGGMANPWVVLLRQDQREEQVVDPDIESAKTATESTPGLVQVLAMPRRPMRWVLLTWCSRCRQGGVLWHVS